MPETLETIRLTADVVALSADADGAPHVLLIRRAYDPFAGRWALPGGHVDPGETVENAARRELAEETGVQAEHLTLATYVSAPGRDPRGRYVTAVFVAWLAGLPTAVGADDADRAEWVPLADALAAAERAELAFDHGHILRSVVPPQAVMSLLEDVLEDVQGDREGGEHDITVSAPAGHISATYTPLGSETEVRWSAQVLVTPEVAW
jgi:8-oxo-dGTP diphosphatase